MFLRSLHRIRGFVTRDAEGSGGGEPNGDATGKDKPKPVEFTTEQQAEINRLLGERATRAGEATQTKLLEALGGKSIEEIKSLLDAKRKSDQAALTEADRLKQEKADLEGRITKAEQAAKDALDAAQKKLLRAALLAEAAKDEHNLRAEALPDVYKFISDDAALLALITPKDDSGDEFVGLDKAIAALVKAKPYLVETADGIGTPRLQQRRTRVPKDDNAKEALKKQMRSRGGYNA